MRALPPVGIASLAYAAGIALAQVGALWPVAPLGLALWVLAPIRSSLRRVGPWIPAIAVVAGALAGLAAEPGRSCAVGERALRGRFIATPGSGTTPFEVQGARCEVRVVLRDPEAPVGRPLELVGAWREGRAGPRFLASGFEGLPPGRLSPRWALVRWRATLVSRLDRQYGERGSLAAALILARREGLDPSLRESFARAGIAHLLAISGFHVGVVAGMALALGRLLGLRRRRAGLAAAGATWAYVSLLGFPDAATRAALIVGLLALSRSRGRPPARWGALGTAFLLLLIHDPGRLQEPGFQLSFAGAAGLVAWAPSLSRGLRAGSGGARVPRAVAAALAAGIAATVATLPVVAWHFERISLVGIPVTLVASPLVAVAVPGALLGLASDLLSAGVGGFLAGGVDAFLSVLERIALMAGSWEGASVWVPRRLLQVAALGVPMGVVTARAGLARGLTRRATIAGWAVAAVVAWPVLVGLSGRGTVQLLFVDVGQGDAIAVRTPLGRWLLVDAGPPATSVGTPPPVVRELARRGVRRLEALVLTHPDLDHNGGARAVLDAFEVGEVVDPARASAKAAYLELLEDARERSIPWRRATEGQTWHLDGLEIQVLAPGDTAVAADTEANASSVVLRVRWGDFDVLLTGDAPAEVERALALGLSGGIELLKVGHHGSDTSSDPLLLSRARPEVAVVSVGANNRFGHPSPRVLDRLAEGGTRILRTDRAGSVRVVGRESGAYQVEARR